MKYHTQKHLRMMGWFKKKAKKKIKKDPKFMTIPELLEDCPWVGAFNSRSIKEKLAENPGAERVWLNPNNQTCFNSGSFTLGEFRQWAQGRGPIVKGKTPEDQAKVIKYAKAYNELDMSIFIYGEYLDLLDSSKTFNIPGGRYAYNIPPEKILKTKGRKKEDVIRDVLSNMIWDVKDRLKSRIRYGRFKADMENIPHAESDKKIISKIKKEFNKESWQAAYTMGLLGYGHFDASNVPTILENLAWSRDLPFAIGYYEWLIEDGYDMPEIALVQKNRYKW